MNIQLEKLQSSTLPSTFSQLQGANKLLRKNSHNMYIQKIHESVSDMSVIIMGSCFGFWVFFLKINVLPKNLCLNYSSFFNLFYPQILNNLT